MMVHDRDAVASWSSVKSKGVIARLARMARFRFARGRPA
jgi:hypothetical protein